MALTVAIIDGMTSCTAGDLTSLLTALLSQEGVIVTDGTDLSVTQADTPSMAVEVKKGSCFVLRDGHTDNNGELKFWHVTLDTDTEVAIDSNSSGSTRIDAICIKVDTAISPDSTSSNNASVVAVKGTPGAGNPTIPDNHLFLYYVTVEDSETQILDADLSDQRQYFGIALPNGNEGYRLQDTSGALDAKLHEDSSGDIYLLGSKSGGGVRIRQALGTVEHRQNHTNDWEAIGSGGGTSIVGGWEDPEETWTYSSVDDPTGVITVPSGAQSKYSIGMRIKFTNATNTVYGIITAVTDTTITFLHEIDPTDNQALNLMQNSAITENYFSHAKTPIDFPLEENKWTIRIVSTGAAITQASPTANTWYNLGSLSIDIPIGFWEVSYQALPYSNTGGAQTSAYTTLSEANNSESDIDFTQGIRVDGAATIYGPVARSKQISLTAKDTRYFNVKTQDSSQNLVGLHRDISPTIIEAKCLYL